MSMPAFWNYLEQLHSARTPLPLEQLLDGGPERVAFLVVDLIRGFTHEGPLASERVRALLDPVASLLTRCHAAGVQHFLFACDSHPPDSPEFASFPPHCLSGTPQAELAQELAHLAIPKTLLPKRSLSAWIGTELEDYLGRHPELRKLVVVGDCTDLCIYQTAMHLRLVANVRHLDWEVIVPAGAVDTYELPVEVAEQIGALAHDGDFLQRVFLYHLQLNGIKVVREIK